MKRLERLDEMIAEPRIILASQSPRRKKLLGRLVDNFEIIPSGCPEDATGSPARVVMQQGYDKALDVFKDNRDALVIACDTIVTIDGEILGKPRDEADAHRMLRKLSGRRHSVLSGLCVMSAQGCVCRLDDTRVDFLEITDAQIDAYIATGEPMDKAGAYAIQDRGGAFVSGYEGDYDNIVGLCVPSLAQILSTRFGVKLRTDI